MKSERRHELQTNYLADHLGSAVQSGKPYAVYVAGALAVALVLSVGYGIYSTQSARANASAWTDYYFNLGSGDGEAFQQIAQDHPGTSAALWSRISWADHQVMTGLEQIFADRSKAESMIDKAIEAYQQVYSSAYDTEIKNRAAIGLAQAYESIGKLEDATKYYKVVASSGQAGFDQLANTRLAWLSSGDGKSFYEWFRSARSKPSTPPQLPGDLSKPPTSPTIEFPTKQNR